MTFKKQRLKLSIGIFLVGITTNYLAHYMHAFHRIDWRNVFLILTILFYSTSLCYAFFVEKLYMRIMGYSRFLFSFIVFWFAFSMLWGVHHHGWIGIGGTIAFDGIYFLLVLSGLLFIGVKQQDLQTFVMYYLFICLFFIAISFPFLSLSVTLGATTRHDAYLYTGSFSGIILGASGSCILLCILGFCFGRSAKLMLGIYSLLVAFVFAGAYYSKRYVFVEVAVLYIFFLFPYFLFGKTAMRRKPVMFTTVIIISFALLGFGFYVAEKNISGNILYQRLVERYLKDSRSIDRYNRFIEAQDFLESATSSEWLIGCGLGSSFRAKHLHIGYANLIYKGGTILFAVIMISLLRNFVSVLYQRDFINKLFIFALTVFVLSELAHSPLWGWMPTVMILGITLFSPDIVKHLR